MRDEPHSKQRLSVDRPIRGADRNQNLVDRADPASNSTLLPSLGEGLTLLDVDGTRGVPVLQSLVVDHLLRHDGPAFWVDADGHATSTAFARIVPSQRLLDRVHVARGFTAYQHYAAVCDIEGAVDRTIQRAATTGRDQHSDSPGTAAPPQPPALVVVPAVDARYRAPDTLPERHAETLQARALARLRTYADGYDVPVLVTRTERDAFTAPVETAADHHLVCEQTRMGPRFVGEEFETLVYPVGDGAYYQTTIAYWRQLLDARAEQVGLEPSASPDGPGSVGAGVTDDGDKASFTADPLLDAWTGPGSAGAGGR